MITIDEFMTSSPYTLSETDTISDARKVMTEKHIRHIPITDNEQHLLGLVTQRDILAVTDPYALKNPEFSPRDGGSERKLSEIMIRDVSIIHQSDSLRQAALYLQSHKYGCLPVVVDKRLVGIITDSDFISIAINLLEQAELAEQDVADDFDEPELLEIDDVI